MTLCLDFLFISDAEQVEGVIPEMRKQCKNTALARLETTQNGHMELGRAVHVDGWQDMKPSSLKGAHSPREEWSLSRRLVRAQPWIQEAKGKGSAVYWLV